MKKKGISKWVIALSIGAVLATGVNVPVAAKEAYPGAWEQTDEGWKYKETSKTSSWYAANGFRQIGKHKYFFNQNGIMQTGWITYDEYRYYANQNGEIVTGLQTIDGNTYYFFTGGRLAVKQIIENKWKTDENGMYDKPIGTWVADEKGWKYMNSMGKFFQKKDALIGTYRYYFGEDGYMQTGWITNNRYTTDIRTHYADESGRLITGWKQIDGLWYYFDKQGDLLKNKIIDGKYYVGADGAMVDTYGKWVKDDTGWWYEYYDGSYPKAEAVIINDKQYFFDANGYMLTGWIDKNKVIGKETEAKDWYYAYADGSTPKYGWNKIDGAWYYFVDRYGHIAQNQKALGYYFDENGTYTDIEESKNKTAEWKKDAKGWWYEYADGSYPVAQTVAINGYLYAFDYDGYMITGWVNTTLFSDVPFYEDDLWYYFEADGKGAIGWKQIGSDWYYFINGGMQKDCYIDGYYIGRDGRWTEDTSYVKK